MIEINWKPDKNSREPLYEQIIKYIADKIRAGDWVAGDRLPSQRSMAEAFEVNRSTVVAAMDELAAYGIIEGARGGGTKVAGGSWSLLLAQPPNWNKYIQSGKFRANKPAIRTINKVEYAPGYSRIGTGELSPSLYPEKMMRGVFAKLPERIHNLNYLEPLGLPELRKEICARVKAECGIDAGPENVLITNGSLQALQLISIGMFESEARVYTEAPTYLKSHYLFQSSGMELRGVPMDREGMEYWTIRDKTAGGDKLMYTIPTHHNPTGRVMSGQRRRELLSFCQRYSMPLIEDDAYGALWFEERPPLSIKSMDKSGTVLYLGTISKTLAPGLRIGWVIGPEAVVNRLSDIKMQTDYGSSSVSQWITADILAGTAYDDYLAGLRRELRARRDNAVSALEKNFCDIADWEKPTGGFYIWLRFKNRIPIDRLFAEAVKRGIIFNPGNVYDYTENHAIRISYSYADPEELSHSLEILAEIINNLA